ncbi:hypothetical protein NBRC10513_006709 [Rhodotorula toruloides]|uniref:Uncharacterized protein n=1 Tax=Rhodotorula toruloides TaxID=5286 RepID=A0A2T0A5K6_RHOTO|nr:hypothetical protein AAT19DRAFT_16057 [Rhodotorula toruloides]
MCGLQGCLLLLRRAPKAGLALAQGGVPGEEDGRSLHRSLRPRPRDDRRCTVVQALPRLDRIPYSRTCTLVTKVPDLFTVLAHPLLPNALLCTSSGLTASPDDDDYFDSEDEEPFEEDEETKQMKEEDRKVCEEKAAALRAALRKYAEGGGRVVLGGPLANYLPFNMIDGMLADLGVSWKAHGYHRTTHFLNVGHPLYASLPGNSQARAALPASYSTKAVLLKNVPAPEMVYHTTPESQVESLSMMLMQAKVTNLEVAVAMGKVGEGWLGWCGDVNQEAGSTQATLWMLGLKK